MQRLWDFLARVLTSVFGKLQWEAPQWLVPIHSSIRRGLGVARTWYRSNPRRAQGSLAGAVVVGLALWGTYYWYSNLPEPVKMSVSLTDVIATPLEKDAKPMPLEVNFGGSAAQLDAIGKTVEKGVRFNPEIPGEWKWTADNQLVFNVKNDWPVGKEVEVVLEKSLFPKHITLQSYRLPLTTPKFSMSFNSTEFHQSPKNSKDKKVIAEVRFSHPVDKKSFEDRIDIKFFVEQGKNRKSREQNLKYTVTYDEYFGKAFIHTQILDLPKYDSKIRVDISKGVSSQSGGPGADYALSDTAVVPGILTHFQFNNANLTLVRNKKYEPEQAMVFEATTDLKQKDLTKNLEVYVLPTDRPPQPGRKTPTRNFGWRVEHVSKEILAQSKKLNLEPIPTENENANIISYKYNVKPGAYLFIRIKKGLKAYGGYELAEAKSFTRKVPKYPKELQIMGEGSLLSLSGAKKLSVLARDLQVVRYKAYRVLPGQIAHLVTQTSGDFKNPNFNSWNFSFKNITESFEVVKDLPEVGPGKTQYSHFDFTNALLSASGQPKGLFYFEAQGYESHNNLSSADATDQRLILLTDIGVISKRSVDGGYDLFLQSIASGTPVAGASVEILGKNGLPIMRQVSDSKGHVRFEDVETFADEKAPTVFIVKKGVDFAFLPFDSHISNMNYSRFDVGGVRSQYQQSSLEAYMFSDRGIYRPGETIHIGSIIKDDDWSRNLSGVKVEMLVTDPKGVMLRRDKDITLNRVGLHGYDFKTEPTWPTGHYGFVLRIKKKNNRYIRLGSVRVKVEEFMPDRLKIKARFSAPIAKGWLKPTDLKGIVSLKNLFGTAAQNRRVSGSLFLSPSYPSFREYRHWNFHDPKKAERSFDESLGEKKTDSEGVVEFNLGLDKFESASYQLRFAAEGFEAEGGRSVKDSNAVIVSPLDYLVGFKKGGDLNFIKKNAKVPVEFLAVNQNLEKIAVNELRLKLVEIRQVSTLVKQSNGTYKYESVPKKYEKWIKDFELADKPTKVQLQTTEPGDFALIVINKEELELNRVDYSVAGASNLTFDLEKNAELQVRLNKSDFNPGDTIEVSIRGPYTGAGLITIEREKVYASKWFKTNTKSSIQKIKVPDDLEGNGYVNVTFVRSLESNEIFMSPLSAGVAAFSINKSSRINKIDLKVPALVRPGKELAIQIKSQKKAKALVFAVNEGILQVANYKNPDPLSHFYKKRALEVKTRQILDLILPEFARIERLKSSEAGGLSEAQALAKGQNPFTRLRDKSVAYWSGLVDVGPSGKVLNYTVPDHFSGQLRVIAVAVAADSMDATTDNTLVRGHFVLSPNVPTFVAPGDKMKISVGVSNNAEESGQQAAINVELSTSKNIKVIGDNKVSLIIDEGSESSATFDVEVTGPLGNANYIFKANHKDKASQRTVTSSVRPATPFITRLQTGYVDAGKDKDLSTPRRMYKEYRTNEVSVSKLPLSLAKGFMDYLKKYPYGCTEQITSKSFPALVLGKYKDFQPKKGSVAEQVQGVTELYAARQGPDGGLSTWPGGGSVNAFHTAYAVHYMTEAKEKGYTIPQNVMSDALDYLKDFSEQEPKDLAMARVQGYAAYLLTRNEKIASKSLSSLEKWLDGYKDKNWVQDVLLLYMASAYKNMQATEKAKKLLNKFDEAKTANPEYNYGIYDDAIKRAVHLYLVARHFPERIGEFDGSKLQILVDRLSKGYNTTSSALAILAFQAYAEKVNAESIKGIKVTEVVDSKQQSLDLSGELFPKSKFSKSASQVSVNNSSKAVAYYSLTQAGFDQGATPEIEEGVEVFREFINANGDTVDSAKIGEELTVRLRLRSLNKFYHYNMAVADLLPGGFEVVLDSIDRIRSAWEYVDAREDRVLIFSNFQPEVKTFEYRIKAINKGTFKVPPIFAESMYNRSVQTKGKAGEIKID